MIKDNTILITGATGLIGSNLAFTLLKKNNRVIALSRNEKKIKSVFAEYLNDDIFDFIVADVGENFNYNIVRNNKWKSPIDVVFHAASSIDMNTITQFPVNIIKPNLYATERILEGLVAQRNETGINARAVVFSSGTVYGNPCTDKDILLGEANTNFSISLNSPNAPYVESKRMAEVLTNAYVTQYNVDAVIVRPSYVYGSSMYMPGCAFTEFIENVIYGHDIVINNSGFSKRDNIFIDDVISALLIILNKANAGEAYNISSMGELGNYAAIDEIAEIICKINNNKTHIKYKIKQEHQRKPGIIFCHSKLKNLGWKLETYLTDGIQKTLMKQRKFLS
jgi:nucleoside-diphosphate-sugar epimerase